MAANTLDGLMHRTGSIDLTDYIAAPAFSVAAFVLVGIGSFSLYGYDLSMTLWSGSGATLTLAWLITVIALGSAWATNRMGDNWDDFDEFESAAVVTGGVLLVGIPFVPFINDLVTGSQIAGTIALVVLGGLYTVLAYY